MSHFVQPSFPTQHEGVERMGKALNSATTSYKKIDGARGLATFLLAAVVSGLVMAANQLIETWADGHLLAAWMVLWIIVFATLALASGPIRRAITSIKAIDGSAMYAAWSARRKLRLQDEKMWEYAQHDSRLMADIMRAVDKMPEADKR